MPNRMTQAARLLVRSRAMNVEDHLLFKAEQLADQAQGKMRLEERIVLCKHVRQAVQRLFEDNLDELRSWLKGGDGEDAPEISHIALHREVTGVLEDITVNLQRWFADSVSSRREERGAKKTAGKGGRQRFLFDMTDAGKASVEESDVLEVIDDLVSLEHGYLLRSILEPVLTVPHMSEECESSAEMSG